MAAAFTGGSRLTAKDGLKFAIHQSMMLNELAGGMGAYQISNAKYAMSGPSFGPIQYDIGGNSAGRVLLEKICRAATNGKGARWVSEADITQLKNNLYKPFVKMTPANKAVYDQLKPKLDGALSSKEGMALVNSDYEKILDKKVAYVKKVINQSRNPNIKKYLAGHIASQTIIADIRNQYGDGVFTPLTQLLHQTKNDKGVRLPPGNVICQIQDQFDVQDLVNFRFATQYGRSNPRDVQRRLNNIYQVTKFNGPTAASKSGIVVAELPNDGSVVAMDQDNMYQDPQDLDSIRMDDAATDEEDWDLDQVDPNASAYQLDPELQAIWQKSEQDFSDSYANQSTGSAVPPARASSNPIAKFFDWVGGLFGGRK